MITTFIDCKTKTEPITANHAATDNQKKQHVVVVEDDEGCTSAFKLLLEPYYRLTMFQTAETALDFVRKNWSDIDLVLLDNKLPGMSGLHMMTVIRKEGRLKQMPVVLQTASYHELLDEAGSLVDEFLEKPFNRRQLLKAIGRALDDKCAHLERANSNS